MYQSLFKACRNIIKNGSSGIQNIGGYDIGIEYYTQENIDNNVKDIQNGFSTSCTFGDSDESKVVLVAGETITIPSGYTLTPVSPKKSLVIMCNTIVNNGTISMTGKGPNVKPHDWFIFGMSDGSLKSNGSEVKENIIIPAYAYNQNKYSYTVPIAPKIGDSGQNGTNRQCGSGGTGGMLRQNNQFGYQCNPGCGYAFGGGAGSGGVDCKFEKAVYDEAGYNEKLTNDVDVTYPMHGGNGYGRGLYYAYGGIGNPSGAGLRNSTKNNQGVGGRIIIYCRNFINNGTITAQGVKGLEKTQYYALGGSSGGGAIDVFASTFTTEGILNVNGGATNVASSATDTKNGGAGGKGSITLSEWTINQVLKGEVKYFSSANMAYLLAQLTERINESRIGE